MDELNGTAGTAVPATAAFHASWASTRGFMMVVFAVPIAFCAMAAFAIGGEAAILVFGICAALLTGLAVVLSGPLWDKVPMVLISPEGITARGVAQVIPWSRVLDLYIDNQQSGPHLVVQVVPGEGKPVMAHRISLNMLNAKLHPVLLQTAYGSFAHHAGDRAMRAAQAHEAHRDAQVAFDAKLARRAPRVWAMPVVMLVCAAVWVANVGSGMKVMQPGADELFRWGANAASAVQAGEWWRLLTAMFLHGGILHLALNMYALWEAGLMVTRLFGNRGFLVIYIGAGLVGNALSLHYAGQTGVSVGASGAVFGVAGAVLAAVMRHRGRFPMGRAKQMLTSLGIFIFYSLAYGFSRQGIDNAAHIGGLLAGLVAGWLLSGRIGDDDMPVASKPRLGVVAALCAAAVIGLVHYTPPAQRDMAVYFSDIKRWNALQAELAQAVQQLKDDSVQVKDGKLDQTVMMRRLQTVHAPALRRIEAGFASLRLPKDEMVARYADAQRRYAGAMAELMVADAQRSLTPTPELADRVKRLSAEAKQASEAMNALNAEAAAKKN